MKKLLLLCLVLLGGVMQVSAIKIYFKPSNYWTPSNPTFYLNIHNSSGWSMHEFSTATDAPSDVYYVECDLDGCTEFNFLRYVGGNQYGYSNNLNSIPTSDTYYVQPNDTYEKWSPSTTTSYLPWRYYFTSDVSGSWKAVAQMTESSGTYTYTFDTDDYSGKYFAWCTGDALSADGTISNWSQVFASGPAGGSAQKMGFLKINYSDMYKDQNGQRWQVLSTLTNAYINISYTPSSHSAVVSAYFTRTLPDAAQGYATFSSTYDVIPDANLTAVQYASYVNNSTGHITWQNFPATGIKSGEGALLKGTAGNTYKFTPASSAVATGGNCLKPITSKAQLSQTSDGNTNFILTLVGTDVGFYKVNENKSWCNAGTAYLAVPGVTSARDFFALDGETTGIANVEINANDNFDANAPMYNLAGQRVNKSYKGVVIVNGKKMLNK